MKQKRAGIAILISDKTDFKEKEDNFILIKGKIHQEGITILNVTSIKHKHTQPHIRPKATDYLKNIKNSLCLSRYFFVLLIFLFLVSIFIFFTVFLKKQRKKKTESMKLGR